MLPIDYIVSSLQPLAFDGVAPYDWDEFLALMPEGFDVPDAAAGIGSLRWRDLETQLRNAMAAARGGDRHSRITAAFQEKNPLKRESLIDRVWWDAAGELTPVSAPLSMGALETYAIRLQIVLKRNRIEKDAGDAVFDRLTATIEP